MSKSRSTERLKAEREKCGLSQHDLAIKAGTTARTISYLESGKHKPSLALAVKIARALGVRVTEFSELWGMTRGEITK